ncbi:hypothetical protein AB0I16_20905 [Streptomyces sp. NPDC050703]|uniref:hypothetical protein n=1 Tax=Streptomyces sp. NPDC050703 TaxID=3157218 RepID=UPI00344AC470
MLFFPLVRAAVVIGAAALPRRAGRRGGRGTLRAADPGRGTGAESPLTVLGEESGRTAEGGAA